MKVLLTLTLLAAAANGYQYERCEFARELLCNQGFQRETLGNWVCLVNYESGYNTAATNDNTNDSRDYGIYQINDDFWCEPPGGSGPGETNDCGILCEDLIDDNIDDDCDCAVIIFGRHGYEAWYGYLNNCQDSCSSSNCESWVSDCDLTC